MSVTGAHSSTGLTAVTGATGVVGGRVASLLSQRGIPQRLVVRDPARAPRLAGSDIALAEGYHDKQAMTAALRGIQTLFLVSGRESAVRVSEHTSAVDAAVDAGVQRIVYLSIVNAAPNATFTLARDHYATEQYIRRTGLDFTFLRDNLYLDFMPLLARADGVIAGPAGDGKLAGVSREDVADAAVAVLTGTGNSGETYDLTGPETFTLAYVAEQLSKVSGRPVSYTNETLEEAYASRASYNAPQFEVDGWVTSYLAIARGEMDVISDSVPRLTGHPAQTLPEFLAAHPESYAHLRRDAGSE